VADLGHIPWPQNKTASRIQNTAAPLQPAVVRDSKRLKEEAFGKLFSGELRALMESEVCRIFCATANPTEVVLAETEQGRGILDVVDGFSPKGVEGEGEIKWRKDFLRKISYKL
jgi:hypothetical protein